MRLTFRAKMMAIVGVAALAFVMMITAGDLIARRVERQLATIQQSYLPKLELQPQLEAQLEKINRGFQDAVAAADKDALAATRDHEREFLARLESAGTAVDATDAAALRSAMEDYFGAAHDLSRRLIAGETGEGLVDTIAAMQAKQALVRERLKRATQFERSDLARAFASAERAETTARQYRLWISVACLVAAGCLSFALSRGVFRSLEALQEGFSRFGKGDFERPIEVARGDELAEVAREANAMAASLKTLSEERRKADEKFRGLLEAAPDSMVIADEGGRVVLVNAQTEALFGYARHELLGEPIDTLVPERVRALYTARRNSCLAGAEPPLEARALELYGRKKDGAEFPIEISLSPIATPEGLVVSTAIRDISQRKETESALKSSNRELEAFSYSVAHDLRAPLRGINGFSRALLEDYSDKLDDEGRGYLHRIAAAAERMGHLIDALLTLSRVARTTIEGETVNLGALAESVMNQLRTIQPDREVEFTCPEKVMAFGDPRLLRALLENLLGNAWKFTDGKAPARIEFGVTEHDGACTYFVGDNGAGFDMAYADKLFKAFQRLHSTTDFAGTGIGLATVQRIAARHGGRVWGEGVVGEGASFYFTLGHPVGSSAP